MTACFELPEYDELTHRRLLPKSALRDGAYYIGRCRNACVARWNARQQCFYHWREKLGRIYIQKIKHPVDEPQYDVFRPLKELLRPRFEIPFNVSARFRGNLGVLGSYSDRVWCTCTHNSARRCLVHRFGRPRTAKGRG